MRIPPENSCHARHLFPQYGSPEAPRDGQISVDLIRVLIADDLSLIRQGIRSALGTFSDVEIVGEAASSEEAVHLARNLEPKVVLLDADLPDTKGLETIRIIKQTMPDVEIIVMTDRLNDLSALEAIEAGATGYILKDIPPANLAAALRSVCNGRAFIHPEIARKLMSHLSRLSRESRASQGLSAKGLTKRDIEILIELAQGKTDAQIAAKFVVAEGTVKTQIHRILRKLGCRNRVQAIAYVLREGLIR